MASNTVLDAGTGGDTVVTKERTHDGDASKQQGVFLSGVSGTEGAYTFVDVDAGGGVEAAALRVTLASDSTGVLSVDDNGASLTVDGTVTANLSATDNAVLDAIAASVAGTLTVGSHAVTNAGAFAVQADAFPATVHSADFDSGAGTDTTLAFGIAVPASGGAAVVPGSATAGLKVDLGADNDVTVTGTVTVDGSGVTQPVSHAALTELAAAINASSQLDVNIAAQAGALTVASHAVTNAGTFAVQATGTVDLGATDNAVLDTIASPVATISATPLQRVAIFDAADAQITSFGGGTEYTEDAAAAANPVGNAVILVRDDVPGALVSADGDNVAQRGTNFGAAFCQIVDSSGNFVDSFGGAGGTSSADDADFVAGTTLGTIVQGVYESTPTNVTDGDVGALGITQTRELKVSVTSGGITGVVEDAASAGGEEGVLAMAVRRDTAASSSGTDGDFSTLNTDASGRLHVNVGTSALPTGASTAANQTTIIGHVDGIEGLLTTIDADTGGMLASLQTLDNVVSGSEAQVDVVAALPAGTNLIGDVGISGARTSGGTTIFRSLDLDETEEEIKATAGQVYWIHAMNLAATKRFLKFYNATAANVTVGTTAPVLTFPLGTQGDTNGAGFTLAIPNGIAFGTAITVAATTGVADNDTGAPGANEVVVNIGYG